MAGLLLAVILAPSLLDAALPDLPHDRVGVYERVRFVEPSSRGSVVAGFIAPAGWLWVGSRESGYFTTTDGLDAIRVELRTDVEDPDALMRSEAPLGAVALPAGEIRAHEGLAVSALEHDLSAGDSPTISVVACAEARPANCLVVLGTFSAGDEVSRDRAENALVSLLLTAEVLE